MDEENKLLSITIVAVFVGLNLALFQAIGCEIRSKEIALEAELATGKNCYFLMRNLICDDQPDTSEGE